MAEPSDRIMKFVGAARNEKGAEAAKELGSLLYDKAAEKLDQFSTDIEFGTDSFAPQEDVTDEVIDQALEAPEDGDSVEEVDDGDVEELPQDDEGVETASDAEKNLATITPVESEEQVETEGTENNGQEDQTDIS